MSQELRRTQDRAHDRGEQQCALSDGTAMGGGSRASTYRWPVHPPGRQARETRWSFSYFDPRLGNSRRRDREVPVATGRHRAQPLPGHPYLHPMDERNTTGITRTSGINSWTVGCGGSRTSGSEGGQQTRQPKGRQGPRPRGYVSRHTPPMPAPSIALGKPTCGRTRIGKLKQGQGPRCWLIRCPLSARKARVHSG
jgi:hypothetical protein